MAGYYASKAYVVSLTPVSYTHLDVYKRQVYSKSNEDSSDFYLGGRTMGPLVTAMSAEASDMSSWLLIDVYKRQVR